jgi:uncharacterized protein GlcG (DUF336 family)
MAITLVIAEKVLDAAKAFAFEKQLPPVNIAVLDHATHLVSFARMDGAILGGIDVAEKKARTAALFRIDSSALANRVIPGATVHTIENSNGGLIAFGGGVLLYDTDGSMIGAIGVSGASTEEDELIAQAAASVSKSQ